METFTSNTPVTVTALSFGRDMRVCPRRIILGGRTYDFVDRGLRTIVRQSGRIAEILTLSDGIRSFRLRTDNHGSSWTLLSVG